MPFLLMPTYTPTLQVHASALPVWRRLLAVADAVVARFQTIWSGLFADVRSGVSITALADTLDTRNILAAHTLLAETWYREAEVPARRVLPAMATEVLQDAAAVAAPDVSRLVGQAVTFTTGLPEVEQWVQTYVGTQIRDISATTLRTVQQVLREGWNAGKTPRTLARELRDVIGLTPRQERTIATLRVRLETEGQTARQIQTASERATQRGLRQRALTVARTESLTLANRGSYEVLRQAVQWGYVAAERVRRDWLVTEGPTTCAECLAIPEMNPDGVGLDEEFVTPFGPLLLPPGHPQCRCTGTTRLVD